MTIPDETSQRSASSGTTRTPPPRARRGAPRSRTTFADVDPLDDLVDPDVDAASDTDADDDDPWERIGDPAAHESPEPNSASAAFDWDDEDPHTPDETVLAAAAAAQLLEVDPEVPFEGPTARPAKTKPLKRPERKFRQTVQKVDLWSVTKMALCFYVSAMGVVVVSLVALWVVADSAGIINNVENFIGDLFSADDFQFASGAVLRGTVLVGIVVVALMVAFTIIAASFYNIFAELFGGVEIVIREEEQPAKR